MRTHETSTDSKDDQPDDERRVVFSADNVHRTPAPAAPEYSTPPPMPPPERTIRLPEFQGILHIQRDTERPLKTGLEVADDDETDEEDENYSRQRAQKPAAPVTAQPSAPQPAAEQHAWPIEDQDTLALSVEQQAAVLDQDLQQYLEQTEYAQEQIEQAQVVAPPAAEQQPVYQAAERLQSPLLDVERPAEHVPRSNGEALDYDTLPPLEKLIIPQQASEQTQPPAPTWNQQPMQQHAAVMAPGQRAPQILSQSANYNAAPLPPNATVGSQPPLPPINHPPASPNYGGGYPSANQPPQTYNANLAPIAPQMGYNQAPATPNQNYNTTPALPTKERRVGPIRDSAARLGVAVVGVGSFIGNRRRKKEIRSNQEKNNANFADIKAQQVRDAETQARQAQEISQLRSAQERMATVPAPFAEQSARQPAAARFTEWTPLMAPSPRIESIPGGPQAHNPNLQPGMAGAPRGAEGQRLATAQPGEQVVTEQGQEDVQPVERQSTEHKRQSSWHNIVVNDRDQEVQGAMNYGDGFRRERKEVVHDRVGDAAAAGTAALAAFQTQPQAQPGTVPQYPGALPSGMTSPALQQGAPTHVDPQHQLPANNRKDSNLPGPIFWVMLLVIIAAFFAAALI